MRSEKQGTTGVLGKTDRALAGGDEEVVVEVEITGVGGKINAIFDLVYFVTTQRARLQQYGCL